MDIGVGRHPAVMDISQYFEYGHLKGKLRQVSQLCAELAEEMINQIEDSPMLTRGLDDLLRAKDCFVRAALSAQRKAGMEE